MTDGYTVRPLSAMRKIIAARMVEAKQTIPHFRLSAEIKMDALMSLRHQLQGHDHADKPTITDLLVKACAAALLDEPDVNIQWVDSTIHQYAAADVSVVVSLPGGLATPIVRNADSKSIWEISREIKELAGRAGKNALRVSEILGGTFSISNLGMYGVDQFDAIINPPQCAILAVGSAKPGFVFSAEREARVATLARMTLSVDHRAIDGAAAARFISAMKRRVEQPQTLQLE